MGGTSEVRAYLFVGQAQLLPYIIPNGFLSRDSQWYVDAVQSHPIDEMFPVAPLPPRHGIAEGAIVQEEAVRYFGR
jgi:hypothetical protein